MLLLLLLFLEVWRLVKNWMVVLNSYFKKKKEEEVDEGGKEFILKFSIKFFWEVLVFYWVKLFLYCKYLISVYRIG